MNKDAVIDKAKEVSELIDHFALTPQDERRVFAWLLTRHGEGRRILRTLCALPLAEIEYRQELELWEEVPDVQPVQF